MHSLSISQHTITAAAVDPTGQWLAFGSSRLGQLLVWEWRSETYVLKQQARPARKLLAARRDVFVWARTSQRAASKLHTSKLHTSFLSGPKRP